MPIFDVEQGGRSFEIDAPDLSTATAALQQHLGGGQQAAAPEAPSLGVGGTLADIAHGAGAGIARGALGLAGLPAVAADLGSQLSDWAFGTNANPGAKQFVAAAGPEALQKRVEANIGPFYQPKTWLGQGAQTIGEFLPAAAGGPEGLLARVATRAVLPAVASEAAGAATAGTPLEGPARVGGALLGGGIPAAARRVATPFAVSGERAAALSTLANEGVQVPAGMAVGSKMLKASESELGGAGYGNAIERMNDQFTAATLKRAGITDATRATPDVINTAADRIGSAFDEVAARNKSIPVTGFDTVASAIAGDFQRLTGQEPKLLNELRGRVGSTIDGDAYQTLQSEIQRYARASSNPELRSALFDMKGALDKSIENGLKNSADAEIWKQARRDWKNLMVVTKAVGGSTEAAAGGIITPAKLTQAIESMKRGSYAKGQGDFADLARAGNQVMKPFQDSGTASRLASRAIPAAIGAAATGGFGALPMIFASALAPSVAGHVLLSKPVQQYLRNQRFVGRAGNVRRNVGAIAPSDSCRDNDDTGTSKA